MATHRILLVEDDAFLASSVAAELNQLGYETLHAVDGAAARRQAQCDAFDLLILDRMLPDLDGIELLESLRQAGNTTPALIVSSLGSVDDKVRGLKAGGDDYIVKPCAFAELAARVEALLRRPQAARETLLQAGDLELDLIDRVARRRGRTIDLLPREFKLLEYIMRRPNQVVTRAMLFEDVWNYRFAPQTNLVDVHIGKIRRKIDEKGEPSIIESVVGAGFRLRAPAH